MKQKVIELSLATAEHEGHLLLRLPRDMAEATALEFGRLGLDCLKAEIERGEKYLTLCKYIRKNQIGPSQVRDILGDLGFHKVRISEINKVSQLNNDMWSELEAKTVGFRKALELSRGAVPLLMENPDETLERLKSVGAIANEPEQEEQEDSDGEGDGEGDSTEKTQKEKEIAKLAGAARGAKALLRAAEYFNWKSGKKYNVGNGYLITITKVPAKGVDKKAKSE